MKTIQNINFDQSQAPYGCQILRLSSFFKKLTGLPQFGKKERVNFFVVLIITEGKGKHFIDFEEYLIEKGSILFITPGQIQQYEHNPQYGGLMLIFSDLFFKKQIGDIGFLAQSSIFDITQNALVKPDPPEFSQILKLLKLFHSEITCSTLFAKEESLQKLASLFFIYVERQNQINNKADSPSNLSQYYRFKQLLEENFIKERNALFYASLMAVSSKTLNRITKSAIQKSAKEFIDFRVIVEIKRLLIFEKMSVKEIAYTLNFNEPTNLIKYFKKHTGETPASHKDRKK
nr:helix-turn-helix transcriptional regulator [uncultured Chryseobacterium sp.]